MFFDRDDLRTKMRAKYDEVFCHDGSRNADPAAVDDAIEWTNAEVNSLLGNKGFTADSIMLLATSKEPVIVAACCWMCADYGALQKPALCNPDTGASPYDKVAKMARKTLDEVTTLRRRLQTEGATGTPQNARSLGIAPAPEPGFQMVPTVSRPSGRGGFILPLIFAVDVVLQFVMRSG